MCQVLFYVLYISSLIQSQNLKDYKDHVSSTSHYYLNLLHDFVMGLSFTEWKSSCAEVQENLVYHLFIT